MGWHELENGDLLSSAEASGFEVMVTGDKNLSYQQNLAGRQLALVVLPTIDWNVLKLNPGPVAAAIDRAVPGNFEQLKRNRFSAPPISHLIAASKHGSL
jgi:hypothetical protein